MNEKTPVFIDFFRRYECTVETLSKYSDVFKTMLSGDFSLVRDSSDGKAYTINYLPKQFELILEFIEAKEMNQRMNPFVHRFRTNEDLKCDVDFLQIQTMKKMIDDLTRIQCIGNCGIKFTDPLLHVKEEENEKIPPVHLFPFEFTAAQRNGSSASPYRNYHKFGLVNVGANTIKKIKFDSKINMNKETTINIRLDTVSSHCKIQDRIGVVNGGNFVLHSLECNATVLEHSAEFLETSVDAQIAHCNSSVFFVSNCGLNSARYTQVSGITHMDIREKPCTILDLKKGSMFDHLIASEACGSIQLWCIDLKKSNKHYEIAHLDFRKPVVTYTETPLPMNRRLIGTSLPVTCEYEAYDGTELFIPNIGASFNPKHNSWFFSEKVDCEACASLVLRSSPDDCTNAPSDTHNSVG